MPEFNESEKLPVHNDVLLLMSKIDSQLDPDRVSMQRRIGIAVSRAIIISGHGLTYRIPPKTRLWL